MSDFRCIQCKAQFGGNSRIGDPDLYCNHASPSHFQDKQFIAEDRVRELEKQLVAYKEAIKKIKQYAAIDEQFTTDKMIEHGVIIYDICLNVQSPDAEKETK